MAPAFKDSGRYGRGDKEMSEQKSVGVFTKEP